MAGRAKGSYNPGDVVLGNWKLNHLIGEGVFGKVYEARREDLGRFSAAAVKIVSVPQSHVEEMIDEIDEFAMVANLKGKNIVGYDDREVVGDKNGASVDVVLRMELLTPFFEYAYGSKLSVRDIIRLGIDICAALEVSQKFNMAHKNIKPENIFVSKMGDFMLGDFGLSQTAEKIAGGLPKKGAYAYVSPELYLGDPCGTSVDTYSLGIVLYRMLNDNRIPFLPEHPEQISGAVYRAAVVKRVRGAPLPKPKNASGRLAEIVLKACAFAPGERYASPRQMREELESILYTKEEAVIAYPRGDLIALKPVEYIEEDDIPFSETIVWEAAAPPEPENAADSRKNEQIEKIERFEISHAPKPPAPAKRQKRNWKLIMLLLAAAMAFFSGAAYIAISAANPKKDPATAQVPTVPQPGGGIAGTTGNTPGNIVNGGYAAVLGDRIYYSNGNDGWTLYTVKTNGSGKAKLNDDKSYGINAAGDFVYYINSTDGKKIYAVKTDGSGRRKVCEDESSNISVEGELIYYSNESDGGAIYAIKTDGSGRRKVCEGRSSNINVEGELIYYSNEDDNGTIYTVKTDGSGVKKIGDDWHARYLNVADGKIYYSNTADNKRLYVMNADGSGNRKLNDDGSHNINVAGGLVYYSNISDGGKIYLINTDGSGKYRLNDDDSQNINLAGDRIYYINIGDNYKMYSIKTDGSDRRAVE